MSIGKRTFQSAGQISQHLIPGAFSRIDSIKGQGGLVSANKGAVMGDCLGGTPQTLLKFGSIAEAVNVLKDGPLLEAVRMAFSPGNSLVPQAVHALRVNTATKSGYTMLETATDIIDLASLDYGLSQNQIIVSLASGTNYGKKVVITYKTDTETFDDIRKQSMIIQETVGATSLTIVNNSGTNTFVTTGANAQSLDLNDYPTIGALVAYLNNETGYTASVIPGEDDVSTLELDSISSVDINTTPVTIESSATEIATVINAGSKYLSASMANDANDLVIPDNFTSVYLTGGSEGTYSATEWGTALTIMEAEDIQFIGTPSPDSAIHALLKTHVNAMSAVTGRKERQALLGGAWGESEAEAVTASGNINSKFVLNVFQGFTQYDVKNVVQNFGASYMACMLMGQKMAGAINMPLTFNSVNVIDLENKLNDTTLENLIENGVCPVNYNAAGLPVIVRQVNTYLVDDLKYNEFSMVSEMNFVSRDLRAHLESAFAGKAGANFYAGVLKGSVEAKLAQYTDLGLFVKDEKGISWWNVQISISGDTVIVDYDAYLTAPINFIFVTQHFHELLLVA